MVLVVIHQIVFVSTFLKDLTLDKSLVVKISNLGTNVIVKASGVVVQSHLGGLAIEVCIKS